MYHRNSAVVERMSRGSHQSFDACVGKSRGTTIEPRDQVQPNTGLASKINQELLGLSELHGGTILMVYYRRAWRGKTRSRFGDTSTAKDMIVLVLCLSKTAGNSSLAAKTRSKF